MPAYMILFQILFSQKTVHCTYIQMVTSGYQFMNLQFVHPSKNMPTEHQLLVKVVSYRKDCRRSFNYIPNLAEHKISEIYNF